MILRTPRTSRALFAVFQDVYTNKKEDNLLNLNTYKPHLPGSPIVKIFCPRQVPYTKRSVLPVAFERCVELNSPTWELWAKMWLSMQKLGLKLKVLKVSSPVDSYFTTIMIEIIFPQDRQMLVHGFMHKNFEIRTIFDWVKAFLVKMTSKIMINAEIEAN